MVTNDCTMNISIKRKRSELANLYDASSPSKNWVKRVHPDFNTTCKRFEPGHNLFTSPKVHPPPKIQLF